MTYAKRHVLIPLAESSACEAAFEQMEVAWQSGDVEAIGAALNGLRPHFIYSNYPCYQRWKELKPQVMRFLWRHWPRDEFWKIGEGQSLYLWEFHAALEPLADEFSGSDLLALCEKCGFPNKNNQPRLTARLVEEPNDELSRWLIERIERDLRSEVRQKAVLTHGAKSPFRVFHCQPFRPDVATPVGILARRSDTCARSQAQQWLRELPFASDQASVRSLLSVALEQNWPELQNDLEVVLDNFSAPSDMRLQLLDFLEKDNPRASLALFFSDLRGPMIPEAREGYLLALEQRLPRWKERGESVKIEMQSVDYASWTMLLRGYFRSIAERNGVALVQSADAGARLCDDLVRVFDNTRPGCMSGCLMGFPLLLFVGFVLQTGMTLALGAASKTGMTLNGATTLVWAVLASSTFTSDFLHGGEARQTRFQMALGSFGSFLVVVIIGVATRWR